MAQSFLDREGVLIVVVAILTLALLAAGGYYLLNPPATDSMSQSDTRLPPVDGEPNTRPVVAGSLRVDTSATFEFMGQEGETVLDLLKADHSVVLDSELLLFGSIVLSIDSFESGPDYYWLYYRDSLRGDRSPEVCTTYSAERIRWVLQRRR